jgi:uncharacterized delta-60 repeat protein
MVRYLYRFKTSYMKYTLTFFYSLIASCLLAQYVGLDEVYGGGDGISSPYFAGVANDSRSNHMIVDASNNSFHFGSTELDGNPTFSCAKLNQLGNYASGFGQSGQTVIGTEYSMTTLLGADFYSNGKILICGTFYDDSYPNYGGVVFRMNANGTLDQSFSNDLVGSFLQTDESDFNIKAVGCAVLDNSKSFAAFQYTEPGFSNLMLVKFTAAGDEDLTFDDDGIKFITIGEELVITDIKDDGNFIYLCGTLVEFDSIYGIVIKMDQNGNFVSEFGNGNYAVVGESIGEFVPSELFIGGEGDIFLTGEDQFNNAFVAKMNYLGNLDQTFNVDGLAVMPDDNSSVGRSVSTTPDGKVMIGGYQVDGEGLDKSFVALFNSDGTPDEGFGVDGIYLPDFGFENDIIQSLHVLDDGDFLTSGYGNMSGAVNQYICAKFHVSGAGVIRIDEPMLNLYPNPTLGELFIRTSGLQNSSIQISNVFGDVVLVAPLNEPQIRIDVSHLSTGVYHALVFDHSGNKWMKSFVKN